MVIDRIKLRQRLALAASGTLGVMIAVIADAVQKNDAAAVSAIGQGVHNVFGPAVPNWVVLVLLVVIGIALCFVMEPQTKKEALMMGAGVISFCMTVVPFNPPPGLSPPTDLEGVGLREISAPRRACGSEAAVRPVAFLAETSDVDVVLTLDPKDGKPITSAAITVLDDRGRTLGRSRFRGAKFAFSQPPGRYVLNLEVAGYSIVRCTIELEPPSEEYLFPLEPTAVPLVAQRLAQGGGRPPPCKESIP